MEPDTPLAVLADAYLRARLAHGHLARSTHKTNRHILLTFANSYAGPVAHLERRHVEAWASMQNVSRDTLRTRMSVVATFCRWLVDASHVAVDPAHGVARPRKTKRLPRGLPSAAVGELFDFCPDVRAELIVSLMVQEGLRCVEVANLEVGDVDLFDRAMLVRGKGGRERILPLSDESLSALRRYLADHPAASGPLIRSYERGKERRGISSGHVSRIVSAWMRDAGIKERPFDRVSAHALRHTAATDALRSGAHVRDVQAMLGHSSLSVTEIYMPLVVDDLRRAMGGRQYRPAASA